MDHKINHLTNKLLDKVLRHSVLRKRPILTLSTTLAVLMLVVTWLFYALPGGRALLKPLLAGIIPTNSSIIVLEPENGTITPPMVVINDNTASNNKYVTTTVTNLTFNPNAMSTMAMAPNPTTKILGANSFSWNWLGLPSAPQTYRGDNTWSVAIHKRGLGDDMQPTLADHGAGCEAPPATHQISTLADSVYICHNHIMTATSDAGYAETTLTPNQLVDWTNGTAVIDYSVSTKHTDARDYTDVWLTPFSENLMHPIKDGVDLQGPAKDAVVVTTGEFATPPNQSLVAEVFSNFWANHVILPSSGPGIDAIVPQSAVTRTQFEIQISKTHIKAGIPSKNYWPVDANFTTPLSFTQAIFQIQHKNYNGCKDQNITSSNPCASSDSWHWSDIAISPSVPFTNIPADTASIHNGGSGYTATSPVVHFTTPAPANSFLRFEALGTNIQASFNGGTPQTATKQSIIGDNGTIHEEHFAPYWTAVPAGTTSVTFSAQNWFGGPWWVRDPAIWSDTQVAVNPPAPQPTPPPPAPSPSPQPPSPPTNTGSSMMTFNAPTAGTYTIWTRMLATDVNSDSYWLQIDTGQGIKVGDGGVPFGSWTWINHRNGDPTNKVLVSLSAGNHTVAVIGRKANTKIDSLILTQDLSFDPSNPAIVDSIPPVVTINSPANNSTISGNAQVNLQATDDHAVSKVDLLLDNNIVGTQSPPQTGNAYTFSLDTTKFASGSHSLLAKATDIAGNVGSSSVLSVTISQPSPNPPPPSPSPPPPPAITGDLNGDGKVNLLDLSILLRNWNNLGGPADLNHDGIVNVIDLSILISNWRP
jgi:hypothetical protein